MTEPDSAHLGQLRDMPSGLLFIIGPHRSGTTLLHQLLAATKAYNFVSTYDVICYGELMENRISGREAMVKTELAQRLSGLSNRGMDRIQVGVDLPEEYGFILGQDAYKPRLTPNTIERFRQICAKKAWLNGAERALLLKEPSEFYGNIGFIHDQFPDARFVFIHRHPLAVLNSQVRSWSTVMTPEQSTYGKLLSSQYAHIVETPELLQKYQQAYDNSTGFEWMMGHLERGCVSYLRDVATIQSRHRFELTYEDLCLAPRRVLVSLSAFLHIELAPPDVRDLVPDRRPATPMALETFERHRPALLAYLDHFGYPDEPL